MAFTQKPFSSVVLEASNHIHLSGKGFRKEQQLISQILQRYLSYHDFTCSINFLMNAFAESNSHAPTNKGNCRREAKCTDGSFKLPTTKKNYHRQRSYRSSQDYQVKPLQ